jgi:ribosomal protein L13
MKIKTWIQEGEKTKDVLSSKESAYTDRIIIVNEHKVKMMAEISPHKQYYRHTLFSNAL